MTSKDCGSEEDTSKKFELQKPQPTIEERIVEIHKQPGQTLGFYIRESSGIDQPSGIFISRLSESSYIGQQGLLRIGDEILGVNGVDLRNSGIDDVVVLMSIPRTLKLHIRRRYSPEQEQPQRQQQKDKPLFVIHAPALLTEQLGGSTSEEEEDESLKPMMQRRGRPDSCQPYHLDEPAQRALELRRLQLEQQAGEDSNDSGLSSENSANSRDPRDLEGQRAVHFAPEHHLVQVHPRPGIQQFGQTKPGLSHLGPARPGLRTAVFQQRHTSSAASSPTTQQGRFGQRRLPQSPSVEYRDSAVQCEPPTAQPSTPTLHQHYPMSSRHGYVPHEYCSDSELHALHHVYSSRGHRPGPSYSSGEEDEYGSPRHQRMLSAAVHQLQQMPQSQQSPSDPYWARRSTEQFFYQPPHSRGAFGAAAWQPATEPPPEFAPVPMPEAFDNPGLSEWPPPLLQDEFGRPLGRRQQLLQQQQQLQLLQQQQQQQQQQLFNQSSARQMSTESLASGLHPFEASHPLLAGAYALPAGLARHSTASSTQTSHPPPVAATAARTTKEDVLNLKGAQKFRVKDWELARFSSKVNKLEFRPCSSDRSAKSPAQLGLAGVDGVLRVHVIAGVGLHSSQSLLRDLYCLLELDSTRVARSMIRTSTDCFEWDEQFDIFCSGARGLGFLLYQWDPRSKHRLCFYGNVNLVSLLSSFRQRYIKSEKIALSLEPKGQLYFEVTFAEVPDVFCREPAQRIGVFGVPLDLLARREKSSIPMLVRKCIDEVERRGLEVAGIYRLCGSSRNKQPVREALDRSAAEADVSAEKVPDIHAVTGVLKDFLCELPEPLFTNALYRMMLDALQVRLPGDPKGGAKLMLSILDCLPPANQETLLLLLDHLKRVAAKADVNKMTTGQLATCLGPLLLFPSPDAARQMDPEILRLDRMSDVLKYILEIWTENKEGRGSTTSAASQSHRGRPVSAPNQAGVGQQQQTQHQPPQQQYRSSSMTRVPAGQSSSRRRFQLGPAGTRSVSCDRRSYHGEMDTV
ncbi:hypothetical protein BOX15_Mlig013375g1 [Macrostomum lignano]|uniref:Rho-GAP domain-containing protein n=3 Tax=Macrostomum lignano TaxID=282301 RepID=A0A267F832_9PLAT|nr:hypothetical protein BOX15_Mlig013375g1 [Macrostomum lignano]